MLNIVLFEPEIPENTGNIGRNCVGFNAKLHLIKPYGFILNNRSVKRAGLDYWKYLQYQEYDDWYEFESKNLVNKKNIKFYLLTKYGKNSVLDINLMDDNNLTDVYLIFGKESKGIDKKILDKYFDKTFYIPMNQNIRSFNLSNCVAIVSNEYHRQNNYKNV